MRTLVVIATAVFLTSDVGRESVQVPSSSKAQLSTSIPAAQPQKYSSVRDAASWLNPYIVVRSEGIEIISKEMPSGRTTVAPEALRASLVGLPVRAWPYGRVVAAQDNGVRSGTKKEDATIRRNHQTVESVLRALHVEVNWWPSA